jgi:hypothetical protein
MRKPYSKQNPPPFWADRRVRLQFEDGWNHVKDGWFLKMPPPGSQKNLGMWGKKKFGIYAYCSACKSKLPEQIKSLMRFAIQ